MSRLATLVLLLGAATAACAAPPELPPAGAASLQPSPDGVFRVAAGGDLQAVLEAAQPGHSIELEAGAVFRGPFVLPEKAGNEWIVIRSSGNLPAAGVRVTPARARSVAILEAASGAVIQAAPGAHHYRFVGLEIRPAPGTFLLNLVLLGIDETSLDRVPHHFSFERCYIHGDPVLGSRRGLALNSAETTVIDSHLSDFKEESADSQAIAGWNGPGPFRIENNFLEGAGENILFGGADPAIRGLVPSDIVIRGNHIRKPLAWKRGEPAYDGSRWSIKNLVELKNARRVTIEGNVIEQNWTASQSGFAILFTVRNQDGTAPWSVVEDVLFAGNVVRRTGSAVNILGRDDSAPSGPTRAIVIRNNFFDDVGAERWGGGGRLFQILDGSADVVIEHNTAWQTANIITTEGRSHARFVFRDNIVLHNEYGVVGAGTGPGNPTLQAFFPAALFRRNVIVGGDARQYPEDNFFPKTREEVGFASTVNYGLRAGSPYRNAATDGRDIGVDWDSLPQLPPEP